MTKLYSFLYLFLVFNATVNAQLIYTPNTFGFIGDYGSDDADEDSVAQLVKSWNPEAIITLGDNNYPDGNAADIDKNIGKYFHDYIDPYSGAYGLGADTNRFWPALGNHDVMTAGGAPYFSYFQLPNNERYYDFVKGDIHFFCLNTDTSEADGCADTSIQATWLKNKLQNSTSRWKIVYGHHSPYCSDSLYGDHEYMQWPFKAWGADIVIAAHAHLYERFVVDSFPYIINGLGGQHIYDFDVVPEPGSIVRYNAKHGALQLKAQPDTLWFRFYTVDYELIDSVFLAKAPVGIDNENSFISLPLKVYPNPSTGSICLDFEDSEIQNGELQISVRGVTGRELYTEKIVVSKSAFRKTLTLPESMASGVYFLKASSESQQYNAKIFLTR